MNKIKWLLANHTHLPEIYLPLEPTDLIPFILLKGWKRAAHLQTHTSWKDLSKFPKFSKRYISHWKNNMYIQVQWQGLNGIVYM